MTVVALFLLFLLNCLNVCPPACAEIAYYDYSADQKAYATAVALLQKDSEIEKSEYENVFHLVLIRTNGTTPDLSENPPFQLLRGAKNRYTAIYLSELEADACVSALKDCTYVLYCERDQKIGAASGNKESKQIFQNSQFHSWGAIRMENGLLNAYAQASGKGSCTVAVIDSGVYGHSLIRPRLTVSGFDYVDIDYDSTSDTFGHGTNVAGIVVDCTKELPVYILPIRILDSSGYGSISNAVNAIDEAVRSGADVINLSLSMYGHSDALDDAILSAYESGVTVVVAAGNEGTDTSMICPAHLQQSGILIVGAASQDDYASSYSNYGVSVDVYAYGDDISCCSLSGGYALQSGTSMAAPHISAVCATLEVLYPGLSSHLIEKWIKEVCTDAEAYVPRLSGLVPRQLPLSLSCASFPVGMQLKLYDSVFPLTCHRQMSIVSSDPEVAYAENGILICCKEGSAIITAGIANWLEIEFVLNVIPADTGQLLLPEALVEIGAEAFSGCSALNKIYISESITVDESAFAAAENIVILCTPDSLVGKKAQLENWKYMFIEK